MAGLALTGWMSQVRFLGKANEATFNCPFFRSHFLTTKSSFPPQPPTSHLTSNEARPPLHRPAGLRRCRRVCGRGTDTVKGENEGGRAWGGGRFVRTALAPQVAMFLAKYFDRFCSARTAGSITRVSRAPPCNKVIA